MSKRNIKDACPFPLNNSSGFTPFNEANASQSAKNNEIDIWSAIDYILALTPTILFVFGLIAFVYGYWIGGMNFAYAGATIMFMGFFILRFDLMTQVGIHTRSRPLPETTELTLWKNEGFITKQEEWGPYINAEFKINPIKYTLGDFLDKARKIKKGHGFCIVSYDAKDKVVWLKTQNNDDSILKHSPEGINTIWAKYEINIHAQ